MFAEFDASWESDVRWCWRSTDQHEIACRSAMAVTLSIRYDDARLVCIAPADII